MRKNASLIRRSSPTTDPPEPIREETMSYHFLYGTINYSYRDERVKRHQAPPALASPSSEQTHEDPIRSSSPSSQPSPRKRGEGADRVRRTVVALTKHTTPYWLAES